MWRSLLSVALSAGLSWGQESTLERMFMPLHSFDVPVPDNFLEHWQLGGTAVRSSNSIVLGPAVPGKRGYLFSKEPITTDSFEMELAFSVHGQQSQLTTSEGFAIWIVPTLPSLDDMNKNPEATLFGFDNPFKGIASFFSIYDRKGAVNPSISGLVNDGTAKLNQSTQVPSSYGIYWNFRNPSEPTMFKLFVFPDKIVGNVKLQSAAQWTQSFEIVVNPEEFAFNGEWFIGLSSLSVDGIASKSPNEGEKVADIISISGMKVYNLNLKMTGEMRKDDAVMGVNLVQPMASGGVVDMTAVQDVLTKMHNAIAELNRAVINKANQDETKLQSVLASVREMGQEIQQIRQHQLRVLETLTKSGVNDRVQGELQGLKSMLSSGFQQFSGMSSSMDHMKQYLTHTSTNTDGIARVLGDSVLNLQDELKSANIKSTVMMSALAVVVGISGVVTYKRLRDMEKKHIL